MNSIEVNGRVLALARRNRSSAFRKASKAIQAVASRFMILRGQHDTDGRKCSEDVKAKTKHQVCLESRIE